MDKQKLDYLDICALKHKVSEDPTSKLMLAIKLELQIQATHYANLLMVESSFEDLCEKMKFEDPYQLSTLCKYMGKVECEQRVKELIKIEPTISMNDLLENAITEPDYYDDFKAGILRRQEEERKRLIRMQRPAIIRLLECSDVEKIEEIVQTELLNEEGQIDFYYIGEQIEQHEVPALSPAFSIYVLDRYR